MQKCISSQKLIVLLPVPGSSAGHLCWLDQCLFSISLNELPVCFFLMQLDGQQWISKYLSKYRCIYWTPSPVIQPCPPRIGYTHDRYMSLCPFISGLPVLLSDAYRDGVHYRWVCAIDLWTFRRDGCSERRIQDFWEEGQDAEGAEGVGCGRRVPSPLGMKYGRVCALSLDFFYFWL